MWRLCWKKQLHLNELVLQDGKFNSTDAEVTY